MKFIRNKTVFFDASFLSLEVLKVFATHYVNLVKLESRPIHGKPWEYMFYVDLEADLAAETFKPILEAIRAKTDYLKILGSY